MDGILKQARDKFQLRQSNDHESEATHETDHLFDQYSFPGSHSWTGPGSQEPSTEPDL